LCLSLGTVQGLNFRDLNIFHDGGHDLSANKVRIGVGTGSAILEVSTAIRLSITSNSDGCSAVGNSVSKIVNASSFELSRQTKLIALSVNSDVLSMLGSKLVNGRLDNTQTASLTHALGRDVGVHTSTVPVTLNNGLGVKRAVDLKLFTDPLQNVSGHEELISGVNSDAWSNLVFLLSRHDLSVGSTELNSSVKAGTVHDIGDGTSEGVLRSGGAVVGSLGAVGNSVLGPAKGSTLIKIEEGELLLKSEPDLFVIMSLEGSGGCLV